MQYQNPSLIGDFGGNVRVAAIYRNQWNQFGTPLQTLYLDAQFKNVFENQDYLSFGVFSFQDKYDRLFYKQYRLMGTVAFNKFLSEKFNISAGLQAGTKHTSKAYNRLLFDRQWDPRTGFLEHSNPTFENFENVSSYQMILNTVVCANFYIGNALHSLDIGVVFINSPRDIYTNSNQTIPLKFSVNAHSYRVISENITLMPKTSIFNSSAVNPFFYR